MSRGAFLCGALAALVALPGVSAAQESASWTRASAPDGSFSAETMCSKADLDSAALLPARVAPGVELAVEHRIVCFKGGMILLAGVVDSSFDALLAEVAADKTIEGTPRLTTIDGKRSFVNRQVEGDQAAQTGFIEMSPTQLVMIVSGVQKGAALSIADQLKAQDRFTASIRFGGARP